MQVLQKVNPRGLGIKFAIILLGFVSQISQIILLRELLVVFFGNELSIGIIFASWLFWVGMGSLICSILSVRIKAPLLIFALFSILVSVILPIQIFFVRFSPGILNILSGEYISIPSIIFLSFTILCISCLLIGAQFVLGVRIWMSQRNSAVIAGNVYILECIGSISGGLIFTFLLVHVLNSFQTAFLLGLINILTSLFLLRSIGHKAAQAAIIVMAFVFAILLTKGDFINDETARKHWQIFNKQWTLVESGDSKYGNVSVLKYRDQYNFYDNGSLLFSVPEVESACITAHLAMVQHDNPVEILLIGGGVSGILREVLKYPVKNVDYIELDPLVISFAMKYLPAIDLEALNDKRVQILYTDGRFYVKGCRKRYDMVIVSIPDPSCAVINRFYTLEFFKEAKHILKRDGVFVTGLSSADNYFGEELLSRNGSVYNTIKKVFTHVLVTPGAFNYFYATDSAGQINLDIDVLKMRFLSRGIDTQGWTEHHYDLYLPEYEVKRVNENLKNSGGFVNRDLEPITYYFHIALWNLWSNTEGFRLFDKLLMVNGLWVIPVVIFLLSLWVISFLLSDLVKKGRIGIRWIRDIDKRYSILLAIFTIGMGGMILEIVLIYLFQSLYGYVYQKAGFIIAAFMSGLLIGSAVFNNIRRMDKNPVLLIAMEGFFSIYAFIIPFLYEEMSGINSSLLIFLQLSVLVIITGFLVGALFPLSCSMYLRYDEEPGRTSGVIYGTDIMGGCIGSLVGGSLLIPVLGVFKTCYFVGIMGIVCFIMLLPHVLYKNKK